MKNLKHISLIILLALLGLGYKYISKSIDETFHPNDSLVKAYYKKHGFVSNGAYTDIIKTTVTIDTLRHQEKIVAINGDTLNTATLSDETRSLLKDIENLKQSPTAAKAMQKRVNDFLKEMNMPHIGPKSPQKRKP